MARANAPLRSLSLERRRSRRAFCACASCRAGRGRLTHEARALHRRDPLSFGVRTCCDVPATASQRQNQLAFAWHTRARHCARCLWGEGAARDPAERTCRAAVIVVASYSMQEHCTGDRPLSVDARPWCDVPPAASQNHQAFVWHSRARHCVRCFSGIGAPREIDVRERRAALVVVDPCVRQRHRTGERHLSVGAQSRCDVPAAASQN